MQKNNDNMNTLSLNAEILQALSKIADDENSLRQALKAIRDIASRKEKEECDSDAYIEKNLTEAFKELKNIKEGMAETYSIEEVINGI